MEDAIVRHYIELEARAVIDIVTRDAAAMVLPYSVPLYSDNGYTWEPAGTAVTARVGGVPVLLTAKHCADALKDGDFDLVIAVDEVAIRIPELKFAWPSDPDDMLDACAVLVPNEALGDLLKRCALLDLSAPTVPGRAGAGALASSFAMLVGFPGALNTTDYDAGRVRPKPTLITLALATTSDATKMAFDARTTETMPRLDGVSGSGIWKVSASRRSDELRPRIDSVELIGIEHTHKDQKLTATPLAPVVAAARALVEHKVDG